MRYTPHLRDQLSSSFNILQPELELSGLYENEQSRTKVSV